MDRDALILLLGRYETRHPDEGETLARVRNLLATRDRAFHRDCFEPGHITSSAWIVAKESGSALFTHHRKLARWLQLGGHADGETNVLRSALREAQEESGLKGFESLPVGSQAEILDIDVHAIPARGKEPAHEHHDIRFLLSVSEAQPIVHQASESKEVRWFSPAAIARTFEEESILRMARKADAWLARDPVGPPDRLA